MPLINYKTLLPLLLIPMLFLTMPAKGDSAKLIAVKGQVQARVPDSEWYQAQGNLAIKERMSLKTGKNSRAIITFGSDSTLTLLSNTEISIKNELGKKTSSTDEPNIILESGSVVIKVSGKGDKSELRISTPAAMIYSVKAVMTIKAESDKLTELGVVDGKACATAKGKSACAESYQTINIKQNSGPSFPAAPGADTLALWREENLIKDNDSGAKPSITIYQPQDGALLNRPNVSVTGKITGSTLTLNGNKVEIHAGGEFSAKSKLAEGENKLTLEASNGEQKKTAVLKVYVDTTPPMLTISQPISGFDPSTLGQCGARRCLIQIFGITEPGVTLHANRMDVSKFVEADGSFFITDFPLDINETSLIIEAEDQFKQRSRQVISVSPPQDSDGDGENDSSDFCPYDPTCK